LALSWEIAKHMRTNPEEQKRGVKKKDN